MASPKLCPHCCKPEPSTAEICSACGQPFDPRKTYAEYPRERANPSALDLNLLPHGSSREEAKPLFSMAFGLLAFAILCVPGISGALSLFAIGVGVAGFKKSPSRAVSCLGIGLGVVGLAISGPMIWRSFLQTR